jgi:hypothetical protein
MAASVSLLGLTRTENLNIFTTRPASDPVAVELEP